MKKHSGIIWCGLLLGLFFATVATAKDMSIHSVVERVQGIEEKAMGRFALGGLVEAELGVQRTDAENTGDIALATAALGVNIGIVEKVSCDFLFLYEEDTAEDREDTAEYIDEGFITVDLGDVQSLSVSVGKMYVPFGNFESHFVSDPLTLELGETNQSALLVTFASEVIEITGVVFNGDVDEARGDDLVGSFAVYGVYTMPGDTMKNIGIKAGASLLTNIADSDGLEEEIPGEIASHVAGVSAFASISYMDKYFLEIEYLGAVSEFDAGELAFDGGNAFAPKTWNLEAAVAVSDRLNLAAKYEGGRDLGDFIPEDRYGVAATWGLYENTRLAAEYLHGEFAGGDTVDKVTAQLAVEF